METIVSDAHPIRVMLVEDEFLISEWVAETLSDYGFAVRTATNAVDALRQIMLAPVDVLFTDMVMPGGMTGFDLAHAALAARPGLKVLFTSGYAEPAIARLGLKAGAWLKKPYTADELAEKVREVLHGPQA